jgi:hypothetical protein
MMVALFTYFPPPTIAYKLSTLMRAHGLLAQSTHHSGEGVPTSGENEDRMDKSVAKADMTSVKPVNTSEDVATIEEGKEGKLIRVTSTMTTTCLRLVLRLY